MITFHVNSNGHDGTVSSPNHTFFLGKLEQAFNQYFMHILSLVTDLNIHSQFTGFSGFIQYDLREPVFVFRMTSKSKPGREQVNFEQHVITFRAAISHEKF